MPDLKSLKGRIDAEFDAFNQGVEQVRQDAKAEYDAREARFKDLFVPAAERVANVIRPRLEVLVERFKDKVHVTPVITDHLREVNLNFDSPLARIDLLFRMSHDAEVKSLLLDQTLEILPILMKFEPQSSLSMPLDKIDEEKIASWIDDRIIYLVQTLGAIYRNQHYLKDHLVTDPVVGVQLPKYAAKAKLDVDGKTHYFISEDTKQIFAKQRNLAAE